MQERAKGATTREAELEDVIEAVKYIKDYSFTPKVIILCDCLDLVMSVTSGSRKQVYCVDQSVFCELLISIRSLDISIEWFNMRK